jgi:hypothetical protein
VSEVLATPAPEDGERETWTRINHLVVPFAEPAAMRDLLKPIPRPARAVTVKGLRTQSGASFAYDRESHTAHFFAAARGGKAVARFLVTNIGRAEALVIANTWVPVVASGASDDEVLQSFLATASRILGGPIVGGPTERIQ